MRVKEENEKEIQSELKKMGVAKCEKKEKQGKENAHDRKVEIFLDNLCLKLGVSEKKDLIEVVRRRMSERAKAF